MNTPFYSLSLELNPKQEDIQILGDGIIQYAKEQTEHQPMEFFAVFLRDHHQSILGGCSGTILYGCLYIDTLWVSPKLRSQGYGRQLMQKALEFGLAKHCSFATVNTMDWEALAFYQKLGFSIEFQRQGFAHGSVFYFLRKSLIQPVTPMELRENNEFPWKQDPILRAIVEELKIEHHCHTIILYGSRARGDSTKTSDYDVAGITALGNKKWIARFNEEQQIFHDIFIFPEHELTIPLASHLHMTDGIVLQDHEDFGANLLNKLKGMACEPEVLSADETTSRKVWYRKMHHRAQVRDIEGKYRHIWAIFSILEDYFSLKKLRYEGPKKAFQYLATHDPDTLNLFEQVLSNTNDLELLKQLIEKITKNR